jgi:hypothetical protein
MSIPTLPGKSRRPNRRPPGWPNTDPEKKPGVHERRPPSDPPGTKNIEREQENQGEIKKPQSPTIKHS